MEQPTKMNDFTKEELQCLLKILDGVYLAHRSVSQDELQEKIQSLIDNYCDHESDVELKRKGGCIPGYSKCIKCGEFYRYE